MGTSPPVSVAMGLLSTGEGEREKQEKIMHFLCSGSPAPILRGMPKARGTGSRYRPPCSLFNVAQLALVPSLNSSATSSRTAQRRATN